MEQAYSLSGISDKDVETQEESYFEEVYSKYLSSGDVIYDIGAFRGVLSSLWAKNGYEVVAFEGSPRNIPFLKENTSSWPHVSIHEIALHERNYEAITRFKDCIRSSHAPDADPEQKITYRELDQYISDNDLPPPAYVKMDIEGMETLALKKCTNLIEKTRPIWQISTHESTETFKYYVDGQPLPNSVGDYPGWVTESDGGFDFSLFSYYDYEIFAGAGDGSKSLNRVTELNGFWEFVVIPSEKII